MRKNLRAATGEVWLAGSENRRTREAGNSARARSLRAHARSRTRAPLRIRTRAQGLGIEIAELNSIFSVWGEGVSGENPQNNLKGFSQQNREDDANSPNRCGPKFSPTRCAGPGSGLSGRAPRPRASSARAVRPWRACAADGSPLSARSPASPGRHKDRRAPSA